MLDFNTRQIIKATAPVLKENGLDLMRHFYARMFIQNPEMREIFNLGNQNSGGQQMALAQAVAAYAENIDDPTVLMPVLTRVAGKHVSLGVRKEHYMVVGRNLLASIREVLGEAATPELINAWTLAYQQLAEMMSGIEQDFYTDMTQSDRGWTGWRSFRVQAKYPESEEITSFELVAADGGSLPRYLPGQYVSVRVMLDELGHRQPRQYSLSDAPGKGCFRISVKREDQSIERPSGMVSNHLHLHINVGDVIEMGPPTGDFFLHEQRTTPVVLVSAGVGVTPMMAMLEHVQSTAPQRKLRFLHAARHANVHAFGNRTRELLANMDDASAWVVYESDKETRHSQQREGVGRLNLDTLMQKGLLPDDADYYVCGPKMFMASQIQALRDLGVKSDKIHAEVFGTGGVPCN